MTRIAKLIVLMLLTAAFSLGCASNKVESVILIGADGFSSAIIRDNPGAFPNIEALMARGTSSLEARSVLPSSSAINWATMLMGATPTMHGYTEWNTTVPDPVSITLSEWGRFPGIFGATRKAYPEAVTGAFYAWDVIGEMIEKEAIDSCLFTDANDDKLVRDASRFIAEKKPRFTLVAFWDPDEYGHEYGWDSAEYIDACQKIDFLVGELVKSIDSNLDPRKTAIIFTSDHGGIEKGHGGKTLNELEVPFVVVGPGIKPGTTIQREVMRFDCAPTVLHLLDLPAPDPWRGKSALR